MATPSAYWKKLRARMNLHVSGGNAVAFTVEEQTFLIEYVDRLEGALREAHTYKALVERTAEQGDKTFIGLWELQMWKEGES